MELGAPSKGPAQQRGWSAGTSNMLTLQLIHKQDLPQVAAPSTDCWYKAALCSRWPHLWYEIAGTR
eukprot:scaffold95904_cov28-Tisochrysis_lutea.AAC.1